MATRAALVSAMDAIRRYERTLVVSLIEGLQAIPGLTFYGMTDPDRFAWRTPTVAVRLSPHTPQDLARFFRDQGMFTWAGNYYAINLTERLGVETLGGMLRVGLVHYNTIEEAAEVVEALHTCAMARRSDKCGEGHGLHRVNEDLKPGLTFTQTLSMRCGATVDARLDVSPIVMFPSLESYHRRVGVLLFPKCLSRDRSRLQFLQPCLLREGSAMATMKSSSVI